VEPLLSWAVQVLSESSGQFESVRGHM
jgi:hypothetical protein